MEGGRWWERCGRGKVVGEVWGGKVVGEVWEGEGGGRGVGGGRLGKGLSDSYGTVS